MLKSTTIAETTFSSGVMIADDHRRGCQKMNGTGGGDEVTMSDDKIGLYARYKTAGWSLTSASGRCYSMFRIP